MPSLPCLNRLYHALPRRTLHSQKPTPTRAIQVKKSEPARTIPDGFQELRIAIGLRSVPQKVNLDLEIS